MPEQQTKKGPAAGTTRPKVKHDDASSIPQIADYRCDKCGGNAFVGMSNLRRLDERGEKQVIPKDERWCLKCAKKAGMP